MNALLLKRSPRIAARILGGSVRTHTLVAVVLALLTPLSLHAAGPKGNKHHRRASQSQSTTFTKRCGLKNCTATRSMFPVLKMKCPGVAGTTCTYQVHVNAQLHVSSMDAGLFRFMINGQPASSGGTDSNGYVSWTNADPDSGIVTWDARSYSVVVDVSNNTPDELHAIQVFFGCTDSDSSGSCDVASGFSSLTADVYTPVFTY
jgi:hypothetical protein